MAFTGSLKLPRPVAKTCGHCSVLILTRQLLLTQLSLPPSSNTSFTSLPNTTLSSQPLLLVPLLSSSLPTAPGRRALGSHSYSLPGSPHLLPLLSPSWVSFQMCLQPPPLPLNATASWTTHAGEHGHNLVLYSEPPLSSSRTSSLLHPREPQGRPVCSDTTSRELPSSFLDMRSLGGLWVLTVKCVLNLALPPRIYCC